MLTTAQDKNTIRKAIGTPAVPTIHPKRMKKMTPKIF